MERSITFDLLRIGNLALPVEKTVESSALLADLAFLRKDPKQDLLKRFLTPQHLPEKETLATCQQLLYNDPLLFDMISMTPSPADMDMVLERCLLTNEYTDKITEVSVTVAKSGKSSMSFQRQMDKDYVRGNQSNLPFFPGGMEPISGEKKHEETFENILSSLQEHLMTIPPGFQRGMLFEEEHASLKQTFGMKDILNLTEFIQESTELSKEEIPPEPVKEDAIDDIVSNVVLKPASLPLPLDQHGEWAHVIDVNTPFDQFDEMVPELAHEYPFELDIFQKHAVYHLENGNSVFVAAHTSAGKTVVAEYAIALSKKHMTRAIYTSPIKALSNQKFRDFKNTFEDVGILTGDVQIKPEASCLVMTTEILRSMLYRGADLIRDVEFVIFDEVHYVNDLERGVVWEEVIIMLPPHVTLILLSATVPNTKEFADWVGRTKKKDIYVISTLKRPVPLEHYVYADREIFKIVDEHRKFLSVGLKQANDAVTRIKDVPVASNRGRGRGGNQTSSRPQKTIQQVKRTNESGDKNLYAKLINLLKKKELLPTIIFTFSKKKCEEYSQSLSNIDLTSGSAEKSEIHVFCQHSLQRLKGSDRELPQILRIRELLTRGIAVHHSGLLPIVKEMVEILFTKGLVKVLFATETFAMGVNAPARSVVFSGIRKHDGRQFRDLLPGEYTQMSGRAGRRGLDTTGVVIINGADEIPDVVTLNKMILGVPTKLASQFRLTYNMILSLLRIEALKVEDMIKKSFSENTSQKKLPDQERKLEEYSKNLAEMPPLECLICSLDIDAFYNASSQILNLTYKMAQLINISPVAMKALNTGRVVIVNNAHFRNSLGILYRLTSSTRATKTFSCIILAEENVTTQHEVLPLPFNHINWSSHSTCQLSTIQISDIIMVTTLQYRLEAETAITDMILSDCKQFLMNLTHETNINGFLPEYDWSKFKDLEFQEAHREKMSLCSILPRCQCIKCPDFVYHYGLVHSRNMIKQQVQELGFLISDQNLELLPDYDQRVQVLKTLNFVSPSGTVELKGRIACEINTADELVLTELILDNFFNDYDPAECVALLSCFVFQEKSQNPPTLTPNLDKGINKIKQVTEHVAEIQRQAGLPVAPDEAVKDLKLGLVEVVHEWARGMAFKQITDLTDVLEGSIVRCIVRLDETLREVKGAARLIGDTNLFKKMDEASELIKRDIVFSASNIMTLIL